MDFLASPKISTRVLVYAMISTLVVAFGGIGAFIASFIAPEFALIGLLVGSALGAFLSVHETTVVGCMGGMIGGLLVSPFVYWVIDFETAYMVVFVFSLFGAFMGEPIAYFWREAQLTTIERTKAQLEEFGE